MPRTDAPHRYAIRGGEQGKERLDVLARVLLPTPRSYSIVRV